MTIATCECPEVTSCVPWLAPRNSFWKTASWPDINDTRVRRRLSKSLGMSVQNLDAGCSDPVVAAFAEASSRVGTRAVARLFTSQESPFYRPRGPGSSPFWDHGYAVGSCGSGLGRGPALQGAGPKGRLTGATKEVK